MTCLIPDPDNREILADGLASTPARLGVWRAGLRPLTSVWLAFRRDHAMARDAVKSELSSEFLENFASASAMPTVQSLARDRRAFILDPACGKRVSEKTIEYLRGACPHGRDVQIVVCDGLSAKAVALNVPRLLPMLEHGLSSLGLTSGKPVVVKYGRVAVADQIAHALSARLAVNLIGERPGLSSASGLSAYLTFNPCPATISSDRTVVSNIDDRGTPAAEAGAYIVALAERIFKHGVSGVALQKIV